jgi:hypothetical protein
MDDDQEEIIEVEENVRPEESADIEEDLLAHPEWVWIGPEPQRIASEFTPTTLCVYTILEEDAKLGNYAAYNPGPHHRICSTFHRHRFSMYEFVFKDLQLKLPFSSLAVEILCWLKLAPSILHPTQWPLRI